MAEIYGFRIQVEGNAVKGIEAIDQKLAGLSASADKTGSVFSGLFKFEMLKQGLSLLGSGAKQVYDFGKQMEQTMLSFEVMTGSKEKAQALQGELKHLADVTPMTDSSIYEAGRTLLNFGVSADKVGKDLSMLSDISGGDTDRFSRLSLVFGQVGAAGKLTGGDLLQMINAGFNPLQEIAQKTGVSYESLREKMSKGQISFKMVQQAMEDATSAGGRFYGMSERMAKTVGGMESTMIGTWQTGMFGMFQAWSGELKGILSIGTDIGKAFSSWVTPKNSEVMTEQKAEMNAMFEVLKKGNLPLEQKKILIDELNTNFGEYYGNLLTEKSTVTDIAIAQGQANDTLIQKIRIASQNEMIKEASEKIGKKQSQATRYRVLAEKAKTGTLTTAEKAGLENELGGAGVGILGAYLGYGDFGTDYVKMFEYYADLRDKEAVAEQGLLEKVIYNQKAGESVKPEVAAKIKQQQEKGIQATAEAELKRLEEENKKLGYNKGTPTKPPIGDNPFGDAAAPAGGMATTGGLGSSKTITMNFNQPLMQITAGSIDGEDLHSDAEKVIDHLTSALMQMSVEQTSV
jgi:tape measure domain-containing protein